MRKYLAFLLGFVLLTSPFWTFLVISLPQSRSPDFGAHLLLGGIVCTACMLWITLPLVRTKFLFVRKLVYGDRA